MINFYDISKSDLDNKEFESGALYCCNDTEEIFLDSASSGERIAISSGIIIVASALPLAPIPGRLYAVIRTGTIHVYIDDKWVNLGDRPQIHFKNIVVPKQGSITLEDTRILETDVAVFVPDLSVVDLVDVDTDITVTCVSGSVSVTSTSTYDLPGVIIVN